MQLGSGTEGMHAQPAPWHRVFVPVVHVMTGEIKRLEVNQTMCKVSSFSFESEKVSVQK